MRTIVSIVPPERLGQLLYTLVRTNENFGEYAVKYGFVSNVWKCELDAGTALRELIAQAVQRNFLTIELRQTCLGEFETDDQHRPLPELLALLPEEFPGVRFNVALCVPFLDESFAATDPMFEAGRMAAVAVAGSAPPHLRLVDLHTADETFCSANVGSIARGIQSLAEAMRDVDGFLSIEHSLQSWKPFYATFHAARELLGMDRQRLRLCFDPCNLLMSPDNPNLGDVTRSLSADELSMVHIKQRDAQHVLEDVRDGLVDWSEQFEALKQIGFREPFLFEVTSSPNLWECIERSLEYMSAEN